MSAASAAPIHITLPDGRVLDFKSGVTGADIAASIGPGLAKAALILEVNGRQWDLFRPIEHDAKIRIITKKDPEALELIRHDAAHVLAMAVQELYPGTQVTIGPAIDDGFYYDFARNEPFTPEDLPKIEAKMHEIIKRDLPTHREVWQRDKAIAHFKGMGEQYKAELIESIPAGEEVSIYYHGDWHDLCRGPHFATTGKIGDAFKLTKIAGAYWRGDARNAQLQRIYGTAWRDKKELEDYLHRLEEAEKRDHRKLGKELDLFHMQEEAVGQVFWHPNGLALYRVLETYARRKFQLADYVEVKTPLLMDHKFWQQSGHWDWYHEHMFVVEVANEEKILALKPMNCPGHIQIFKQGLRSYRELPIRMAEFGSCHRYEPSGALHGLMRVRGFTQDDAHIFCTPEQMVGEAARASRLIFEVYKELGFEHVDVKLSTRPEKRIGSEAVWDLAESDLAKACDAVGVPYTLNPGEGAFYGPKLEFTLHDAIGREWQCGTVQVDFNLPTRLGAEYVAEDGSRQRPAMLHRAVLGSMERFIGVLIEHYAGAFPTWLAPVQARVIPISEKANAYAQSVRDTLFRTQLPHGMGGMRVDIDLGNERMQKKIRDAQLLKIPYMLVVGEREAAEGKVAVRLRSGKDLGPMPLESVTERIKKEAESRTDVAE
ncbi:MAG TPA: threonine--tRNA ligase [Rhizomicrobium sp.]|jgi:threonyl-tRNA synthetase|nr:threonine--tRNA ligase [Rhizomicrobium sp.]